VRPTCPSACQPPPSSTRAPSDRLEGEKLRDCAAPKRGSAASGASPLDDTVTRSLRRPALKVVEPSVNSSSRNTALLFVSVPGTKASSPSAEKSSCSVCTPNTPSSPASGLWRTSARSSSPRLEKRVPTSPLPSISSCA
jgi:hypothetical protein